MVPPKRRGRCSRITHVESVRSQRMMKRSLCICHEVSRWVVLRCVPDLHCSVSAVESRGWNLGLGSQGRVLKGIKSTHAPRSTHYAPSTIHHPLQTRPLTPILDIITKPEPALIPRLPLDPGYIATVTALAVAAFPIWAFEKKQDDPTQRTRPAYAFHALRKPSHFVLHQNPPYRLSSSQKKEDRLFTRPIPQDKNGTLSVSPGKKASRKKQPRNRLPPSSAHLRRHTAHASRSERKKKTPNQPHCASERVKKSLSRQCPPTSSTASAGRGPSSASTLSCRTWTTRPPNG